MNCSECQALLADYALDLVDEASATEIATHLASNCEACRRSLVEHQATWHTIAGELTPIEPPPEIKRRLMSKLGLGHKRPSSSPPFTPVVTDASLHPQGRQEGRLFAVAMPFIAATLVGIFAGFCYQFPVAQVDSQRLADATMQYQQHLDQQQRGFGRAEIQLASLQPAAENGAMQGQFLWDAMAQQIHVYVSNLDAVDAGQALRMWFVTADDRWFPGAILERQSDHYWTAVCDIPPRTSPEPSAALARLVVVEHEASAVGEGEPAQAKPPGRIRLEGAIP